MSRVQRWVVTTAAAVFLLIVVIVSVALYVGHQANVKAEKERQAQIVEQERAAAAAEEARQAQIAESRRRAQPAIDAVKRCGQLANDMAQQRITYDQFMAHCRNGAYQP